MPSDAPDMQASGGWLGKWDAYWFPRTSGIRLAVVRILVVGLQLVWFHPSLANQLDLAHANPAFIDPQAIMRWLSAIVGADALRHATTLTTLYWVTMAAGVFGVIGLLTRPAILIFALGNWFLQAHDYSYGDKHHAQAIFCILLLLLALAPSGRVLSVDWLLRKNRLRDKPGLARQWGPGAVFTTAMWPLLVVQWLLAMAYFCAGLCKIAIGKLAWFNGYTLQGYLLEDAIRWNCPVGIWLAQQHTLCIVLAIGAVAFELGFPLILIFRRLTPVFLLGGIAMHVGIYITQAAPFWQFLVLYSVFVPWERLPVFAGGAATGHLSDQSRGRAGLERVH